LLGRVDRPCSRLLRVRAESDSQRWFLGQGFISCRIGVLAIAVVTTVLLRYQWFVILTSRANSHADDKVMGLSPPDSSQLRAQQTNSPDAH